MNFKEAVTYLKDTSEAELIAQYCKDLNNPNCSFYCENVENASFADWLIAKAELKIWKNARPLF